MSHMKKFLIVSGILALSCLSVLISGIILTSNDRVHAANLSNDEQKVYNFLIQDDGSDITNAQKLGLSDLANSATWSSYIKFDTSGYLTNINIPNKHLHGSLDLSNCTKLTELLCYNSQFSQNSLTSIDVTNCTELHDFNCDYNSLTFLDLSTNIKIWEIWCNHNQLTELILPNTNTLEYGLSCSNNLL